MTKISAASAITALADTDELAVASSGASKKITGADIKAAVIAAGATADVLPTGAIAQTYPRWLGAANLTGALVSQKMNLYGIWLPKRRTVTSITFISGTTALSAGVHQLFGLYDSSLALLGKTADATSAAWGSNTPKTLSLTTPFVTTYSGLHYVAIMVQATTVPTLLGFNSGNTGTIGIAPVLGGESTGSLTDLPATAVAITARSNFPYAYLS